MTVHIEIECGTHGQELECHRAGLPGEEDLEMICCITTAGDAFPVNQIAVPDPGYFDESLA
jgi:hypothetical protein